VPRPDDEATVVLRRPAAGTTTPASRPARRSALAWILALVLVLGGVGGAAWLWLGRAPPPAPAPVAEAPPPRLDPARLADPATILAHRASALTVFRLAENPRILVFDFPSLAEQGRMMNRLAALVEKEGLPRDRVLGDAELAAAIAERGETEETFYFGHNYRVTHIARFFALAARDGIALNEAERRLAAILAETGVAPAGPDGLPRPVAEAAVISLSAVENPHPPPGGRMAVDAGVRASILRHELSHGEFFTNPHFAAHVARWWRERLTEAERAAFRRFLAQGGYDPGEEEIMMNEAMAYLMHTPDPRFFNAAAIGVTEAALEDMRRRFRDGMPQTWLSRVWPRRQRSATSTIRTRAATRPARPSARRSRRAAR
jgi:multidrug efflux pump subunit AcrA (membrane-fusion protein)